MLNLFKTDKDEYDRLVIGYTAGALIAMTSLFIATNMNGYLGLYIFLGLSGTFIAYYLYTIANKLPELKALPFFNKFSREKQYPKDELITKVEPVRTITTTELKQIPKQTTCSFCSYENRIGANKCGVCNKRL